MHRFKKRPSRNLLVLITASAIVAACGGGGGNSGNPSDPTPPPDNSEPTSAFSELSVQEGTAPKQILFSWQFDGDRAGFRLEVNPDGVSGYQTADINGDDIVDEADQLAADTEQLAIEIPLHLTDRIQARYQLVALDTAGDELERSSELSLTQIDLNALAGYIKASNTDANDSFGYDVALSADGKTLAVGAAYQDSSGQGITAGSTGETDNTATSSGAVYVFSNQDGLWSQEAYIKPSNADVGDHFGNSLALSADGNTLAVGAPQEDSIAVGISADGSAGSNNRAEDSGAAYLFTRSDGQWTQAAYIKASNAEAGDEFGDAIALSANGEILAIGAIRESSSATGISYDHSGELDNSIERSGAVYLFIQADSQWTQQAYIKASNTDGRDYFGSPLALSADGNTLAVGATEESSSATGVSADGSGEEDNGAYGAGAVYVFNRNDALWSQVAYVKASNTGEGDQFGGSLALSADGKTLAVGAIFEDSDYYCYAGHEAYGVDESANDGAVYIFTLTNELWSQQTLIKEDLGEECRHLLGSAIALSDDGNTLVAGVRGTNTSAGAAFVYHRTDSTWAKGNQVTAPHPDSEDYFGNALALSDDGKILAVGAASEDSSARGIGGDAQDNQAENSGAVYIY